MKKALIVLLFAAFGSGCTQYHIGVSGFTPTEATLQIPQYSSIYVVEDSNAVNPLLEKEIAAKIQKILNTKEYTPATDEPDYYLLFTYGIDSGRTVTGTMPIYQRGGTATATTFDSYGGSSWSTIDIPGHTTYIPYSKTIYTRWLVLKLIDGNSYRDSQKIEPVWMGVATSGGSSSDLRKVINYMLVAAFEHFGEDTGKRIKKVLLGIDKRAKLLAEH